MDAFLVMLWRAVVRPLLAAITVVAAPAAASAQLGLDVGARICGGDRQRGENDEDYRARLFREDAIPAWIWTAIDAMQAAPEEMKFTPRLVDGERILIAEGLIDDNAAARLAEALRRNAPVSEIWFNSPGGNSEVGMEIGHLLRDRFDRVSVRVRAGQGCASACSTAFLGGFMRTVEPGAVYGVHMYSSKPDGLGRLRLSEELFNDIQWQGAKGASERLAYVQQMGISVKWLDLWSTTPPGCMTFLSHDEMQKTLVDNVIR